MHELSGSRFYLPAWENQYGRMAVKSTAKHLGALNTKIDAAILDA